MKSNHHLETICLVIFSQMSPIYHALASLLLHLDDLRGFDFFLSAEDLHQLCACVLFSALGFGLKNYEPELKI